MELKANFHTHTIFCDGSDTAEDVVKEAIRLGFRHLGFSGHMDPDIHMDIEKYYREIRRLQEKYSAKIEILRGIELDNLYDPACSYDAEYCIGSTHFLDLPMEIPMSVDNKPEMVEEMCKEYFSGDYYKLTKAYYDLEAKVYDRTKCTFVGHFDLVTRFNDERGWFDESDPRYYMPALSAMEYLVSEGVPFEVNCGAVNRGRKKDFYPNHFLLKNLKEFGGEILINSDAHQKELLNGAFPQALELVKSLGFDHINILTKEGSGKLHFKEIPL